MKTDSYTKLLLTVIAVCFMAIVANQFGIFPSAYAASSEGSGSNLSNYALIPINPDGSIDVNIKSSNSEMEVILTSISTRDVLNVNVEEVGGYVTGGTIDVNVQ